MKELLNVLGKILKFFSKLIFNMVFYTILVVFVYMVATYITNDFDRTKMNFLGYSPTVVVSESMLPEMEVGDFVLTRQAKFKDVNVGDIIVYRYDYHGGYEAIIHRVIEKNDEYLICKGDNNEAADPWNIYPEDVRAVVVWNKNIPIDETPAIENETETIPETTVPETEETQN